MRSISSSPYTHRISHPSPPHPPGPLPSPALRYVRPWKRLLTFARVSLGAGASTRVALNVSTAQLAFQDDSSAAGVWRVVPGDYQIRVAAG